MIAAPTTQKYCYVSCPKGVPCSCRARRYNEFIKVLDEDDEKIYGSNPMPNNVLNVQGSDTTGGEQRTEP